MEPYMRGTMRSVVCCLVWVCLAGVGCGGDDAVQRPIGSSCESGDECQQGICGGGRCLDPENDDDFDGIVNRIEAELQTESDARGLGR